ncbi:tripartite tricarboxylate transporter substrate binding protein [Roseococcus sp. SDR]|uniref:Bug family tripartite tricarboxylate transporter substrate binding protein n=1 Tax=Roseococcus sp. SDR TaxID=2835532 RepID=UPI001BCFC127|nr:tripartite tricarboxylate transporter substrate-binding protein [Roseococcus sp. SDR]MBS7789030.1 tripartite tricarboxylate transporter substrate binding protein [Roseococcus sp. SDR]MBV1844344.1 tripartite tricarboxylate transporter substrate binding protein [Roseococcus sp. SDR]
MMLSRRQLPMIGAGLAVAGGTQAQAQRAWEPQRPVQFIVPAGTGGGADQMARIIQGIITKHSLMRQPMMVVNKAGGAGAEGFLEARNARGNPHVLIISLSNLFTTPMSTGIPFSWRDLTPVKMMALDEFVLWVNASSPWQTLPQFVEAARAGRIRIGGTGSKQEDQIITVAMQRAMGTEFIYVPFRGGGEVATQLVGGHIQATVNNPIEAVTHWRAGTLRPLCVFDTRRLPGEGRITDTMGWQDIPTCKEAGLDVEYLMLRGVFAAPGITAPQIAFYTDLLNRVTQTPEWRELMANGAFNTTTMTGAPFVEWLTREEARHRSLMQEAGFLAAGG